MKWIKRKLVSKTGFTLVEIIVVLVVLAVLAAFTIPTMLGFVEDARGKAYIAEAREVYVAAQAVATEYLATQGSNETFNNSGNNANDALNSYYVSQVGNGGTYNPASVQMKNYLGPDFPNISTLTYRGDYAEGDAYWYIEFDQAEKDSAKVTEVYYVRNGYVVRFSDEKTSVEKLLPPDERPTSPWGE